MCAVIDANRKTAHAPAAPVGVVVYRVGLATHTYLSAAVVVS